MSEKTLVVRCDCGWETTGTESEVIDATRSHGEDVHNMVPSREQVLAMSAPAGAAD